MAPHLGTAILFIKKYYYTKGFSSIMREPVPRLGAPSHEKDKVMANSQNNPLV